MKAIAVSDFSPPTASSAASSTCRPRSRSRRQVVLRLAELPLGLGRRHRSSATGAPSSSPRRPAPASSRLSSRTSRRWPRPPEQLLGDLLEVLRRGRTSPRTSRGSAIGVADQALELAQGGLEIRASRSSSSTCAIASSYSCGSGLNGSSCSRRCASRSIRAAACDCSASSGSVAGSGSRPAAASSWPSAPLASASRRVPAARDLRARDRRWPPRSRVWTSASAARTCAALPASAARRRGGRHSSWRAGPPTRARSPRPGRIVSAVASRSTARPSARRGESLVAEATRRPLPALGALRSASRRTAAARGG